MRARCALSSPRNGVLVLTSSLPAGQGLTGYYANLHRDWCWGEAENRASCQAVVDALGQARPQRLLVLELPAFLARGTWMGVATSRTLYRSVVAHEVAHALVAAHLGARALASAGQIDQNELSRHLQLVIRDTAQKPLDNVGWLRAEQRWTLDNFDEAIDILQLGLGFCWLPDFLATDALNAGSLVKLNLTQGSERVAAISLVTPQEETLGPGSKQLRQLILAAHQKN